MREQGFGSIEPQKPKDEMVKDLENTLNNGEGGDDSKEDVVGANAILDSVQDQVNKDTQESEEYKRKVFEEIILDHPHLKMFFSNSIPEEKIKTSDEIPFLKEGVEDSLRNNDITDILLYIPFEGIEYRAIKIDEDQYLLFTYSKLESYDTYHMDKILGKINGLVKEYEDEISKTGSFIEKAGKVGDKDRVEWLKSLQKDTGLFYRFSNIDPDLKDE